MQASPPSRLAPFTQWRAVRYAAHSVMAPHAHDEPWLCLVVEGAYQEHIHTRAHEHGPGDLLYCPPHTAHAQRFGPGGASKILFSPAPWTLDFLSDQGVDLKTASHPGAAATLLRLGRRLAHELAIGDAFTPLTCDGLALEMVAAIGRGERVRGTRPPPWLRALREHLDDRLDASLAEDCSLDELAAVAQRHPVHVARSFRAFYGCTLGDYLRRRRAERAAGLLATTRQPLTDIAMACGYASSAHFSRAFRAVYGVTPSVYRQGSR
jgi:AraC family transcriptional regulator